MPRVRAATAAAGCARWPGTSPRGRDRVEEGERAGSNRWSGCPGNSWRFLRDVIGDAERILSTQKTHCQVSSSLFRGPLRLNTRRRAFPVLELALQLIERQ